MLYIKEDYDLVEALLREQVEAGDGGDEMMLEYKKTQVMIDMMDRIIAIMVGGRGRRSLLSLTKCPVCHAQ